MAITITDLTPSGWRRNKVFRAVSDGSAPAPSTPVAHGLASISGAPVINSKALADSQIMVGLRIEGAVYVNDLVSMTFCDSAGMATNGDYFTVSMPASTTAFITMRRPHTSTR